VSEQPRDSRSCVAFDKNAQASPEGVQRIVKIPKTIFFALFGILVFSGKMHAQVASPKHESRLRHLFGSHRDSDNLEQRYKDLSCALVVIKSGNSQGTGFYISPDGDVVTALHVLGNKIVERVGIGDQFKITLNSADTITIRNTREEFVVPIANLDHSNGDAWGADLALIKTGKPATCWLRSGDDATAKPGQHVISLGFPGLAFGSLSLYTGIISAKLKSDLLIGTTTTGQPLKATNEFLRVQMPISTGISGAPVIDDENRVLAVVTQAGAWFSDLEVLTQLQRMRDAAGNQQNNSSDLVSATAHLAEVFHDFASPGYGDAVPLSYLAKKAQQANQQPEAHVH